MNDELKFSRLEKTCPCCGKLFFITAHGCWAYKINRRRQGKNIFDYYCSYTCFLRANEQRTMHKRKVTGVYLTNLRSILDRLNLSYKAAGEMCGVSNSNLYKYANLYSRAKTETVERISDGLGVSAEELIGGKKNE
ncbi:MAG: helix-turn-helix domain-containing protein [Acutalibacteraceae bacterium]